MNMDLFITSLMKHAASLLEKAQIINKKTVCIILSHIINILQREFSIS